MSQHTPGPWHYTECLQNNRYGPPLTIRGPEKQDLIASISGACLHDPRHGANARLIAAAPDMLSALERSLQYILLAYREAVEEKADRAKIAEKDLELVRAAIAKATGE